MKSCCNHTKNDKVCRRESDQKVFSLPRKFSKKRCRRAKGFTMRSSCAPYKDCYKKRRTRKSGKKRSQKKRPKSNKHLTSKNLPKSKNRH